MREQKNLWHYNKHGKFRGDPQNCVVKFGVNLKHENSHAKFTPPRARSPLVLQGTRVLTPNCCYSTVLHHRNVLHLGGMFARRAPGTCPARYLCIKNLICSPKFILTLGSPPSRPH